MKRTAALAIAKVLAGDGQIEDREIEECATDIARHGRQHMDGYELAKALDDYCGWYCTLQMAETLDRFQAELRDEVERAQKAWVLAENIQPPLPIGARVRVGKREQGWITGIFEYGPAQFLVAVDGDATCSPDQKARRIVNFEDVGALDAGGPAEHGSKAE